MKVHDFRLLCSDRSVSIVTDEEGEIIYVQLAGVNLDREEYDELVRRVDDFEEDLEWKNQN